MEEKKFTAEDIITVLESQGGKKLSFLEWERLKTVSNRHIVDLIHRLQDENKRLKENNANQVRMRCDMQRKFDDLQNLCIEQKAEIERLTEEKTCENISKANPVDGFTCSKCGIMITDYVEERFNEEECDTTFHEYEFKYCPNCGAKVVQNGNL